jgi:translation initiation factor 6
MKISRIKFGNSSDIGVYARITNSYGLIPYSISDNFFSAFESKIESKVPLIQCTVGSTNIIGRLTVGNSHGLVLPQITSDYELQNIRDKLPGSVVVQRVSEKLSALGNVISCNDHVAIINPELDSETVEIISDVLQVDTFPALIGTESLVGSYSAFTNRGGVVSPIITIEQMEELSAQMGIEIITATINKGNTTVSSGICVNDWLMFCGLDSTALEISKLSRIFKIENINSI